jgi:hypothetical protein
MTSNKLSASIENNVFGGCKKAKLRAKLDGEIFIKHISSENVKERDSYHQNFHHDRHINPLITNRG